MSTKKNKPPLALGMDFDEAIHRFARVDPEEIKHKSDKKRPPSKENLNSKA